MSSIKSTQIDGDVSVSRNAAVGGDVTVQGKTHLKGNVKIEGWLEAKNIKAASKGLFTTIEKLKAAYPFPHDGWWALVGLSLPAPIYVGDGGEWVPTGQTGGNPSIDSGKFNEAVEKLQEDITKLQDDVSDIEDKNNSQDTNLTTLGNSVNSLQEQVNTTKDTANKASAKANEVGNQLNDFKGTKGENGGIAPLNEYGKVPSRYLPASMDDVKDFDGFVEKVVVQPSSIGKSSTDDGCKIYYHKDTDSLVLFYDGVYYNNWLDSELFGDSTINGITPSSDKVFADTTTNKTYRWSGSTLVVIGSDLALGHTDSTAFPGNEGAELQQKMTQASDEIEKNKGALSSHYKQIVARSVVNVNQLFGLTDRKITFSVALDRCATSEYAESLQIPGVVLTFQSEAGWQSKQWVITDDWNKESNWADFGTSGGGSVGNTINVNALCKDAEYTLSTAIKAILDLEKESGAAYIKSGIVVTFKTAETDTNGAPVWLAYQFTREVSDVNPDDLKPWVAFGSGGGKVETSDKPAKEGKDALSTGGAYMMQEKAIGGFDEESDEDYIYYKAVNLNGGQIEDVVLKIPKNGGGGGSSEDSTLSIYFEDVAPIVAFGSDIKINVALRSVSYPGGVETLGVIRNVSIIDASTGLVLYSEDMNTVGSASATDYKFELDFTGYFSGAASKSFFVQATDADGNTKKKAITVVAVDITVEQPMALNYTSDTVLTVGGPAKNIGQFYKFPNNTSSILATVEMYYNGEWKKLGEAMVSDSYTKSISVNPNNVFGGGERLSHGAYPVRIFGTESKSGVKGNTIYSALMCIDEGNNTPIVALRFNDKNNGALRLYDNLTVEVAAYTPGKTETHIDVFYDEEKATSVDAMIAETITVNKQISGYKTDGSQSITVHAESGNVSTNEIEVTVKGSAIDIAIKDGALFGFDFSTRSNSESDHTISNNGVKMEVTGANWSSNGFMDYLGERTLRIAENVKAEILDYRPFGNPSVESASGCVFQFAFATKNIKDANSKLIECYDPDSGAGFYVCGNRAAIFCKTGQPALVERSFKSAEKHTMAVVVEPSTIFVVRGGSNYSCMKLYLDGEEVGCIGYISNSGAILNSKTIKFDGTEGDLYLYYVLAYNSYYEWAQAFRNYLCKLTDTTAMIDEYERENVLDTQNRPTLEALATKGIPYYVVVADQQTFDTFDGDIDTSKKFMCTLYYYDPKRPWRSFKAINVQWRRQGTTSAKRPIKNDRFYLQKNDGWQVTPIYPEYTNEDALTSYELMKIGYVRVGENTIPVCIITVKVDYSDSSNANDCGVCNLMNATYRALGKNYLTPAQRAFDGTWKKGDISLEGLTMNHSTANHPIAAFRSTMDSLTDAWFHAKGNWKEDKGEQVALGFQNTPGYNKGCVNYGDFIEYFGKRDETLDEIESRFKSDSTTDKGKLYMLSLYCGENYRFMAYESGEWKSQGGEMKQVDGKWQITGKVLNPVSGYELLTYDAMNWWQGVGSIDDMMEPTTAESSWVTKLKLGQPTYPMWTRYFECMIDDDQLQEDLAMGRKVPYDLFNVLRFCDSCDYAKEELKDTWKENWKTKMWKYMNPYSLVSYYLFTDYLAAVDQQAKNMQPMWFLEDGCSVKDGVYNGANGMEARRMYCNKVYDCDTCNGKDNDGGQTIDPEVDPGDLTSSAYAGRGSVLWNDIRGQQTMEVDQNGNTITLSAIADTMRSLPDTLGIGSGPFSPKGAQHYFVTEILKKWPKVVSSYDGERKYIKYTGYSDIYFYALQGLGLTSLPAFIEQRWRIRDGYYRCGDFKAESGYIGGRIGAKEGAVIRFKAAKTGYFGIGNDSGNITQGIYLKAGEEGVFNNFQHGENIMLYIYQADRMSMIDLSEISIDPQFGNTLSKMALLQELYLGSTTHSDWTMSPGNTGYMTNLDLGDMPFLRIFDIRHTELLSVNASKCPRLEKVYAEGTGLSTIDLSETAPISTLTLPGTMTELVLNNLPNLTYPGGLTLGGVEKVTKIFVNECPYVDAMTLLEQIVNASALKTVRIPNVNATASVNLLRSIKNNGAIGLDSNGNAYDERNQCSGITGRWILSELVETNEVDTLSDYFPQLELHNSQFSIVKISDVVDNDSCEKYSNPENSTGADYGNTYIPSGHTLAIKKGCHAYKCSFNTKKNQMEGVQLSDTDFNYLNDGSSFDVADTAGEGFDIFWHAPHHWYKGVNDYKNQVKYFITSTTESEPLSTAMHSRKAKLSGLLHKENTGVYANDAIVGEVMGEDVISTASNTNSYKMDVSGMKQVRWPGLNHARLGGVFTDGNHRVLGVFIMSVSHTYFDFSIGDYIFCDIPNGAKWFYFTSFRDIGDIECLAVDSESIEAIEPEWTEHTVGDNDSLIGIYPVTIDGLKMPRSLSGETRSKKGSGTSVTSAEWKYDSDGNPIEMPIGNLNYTSKDFQNICRLRGAGYQLQDYEQHKEVSNLWWALNGTTNEQSIVGNGGHDAILNRLDNIGMSDSNHTGNTLNSILGLKHYVGCDSEWMDYIAFNIPSYEAFYKARCTDADNSYPVDYTAHIYDPISKTERTVKSVDASNGNCVVRVVHGAKCDVLPSRVHKTDTSMYVSHYAAGFWINGSRGRFVLRSGSYSNAHGGLACALASNASSNSCTYYGARLAFRGKFVIIE
ncbi:hypothetical protein [Bacteroides finegoldii]|uniref:hypothetical protein n=1 Tax=Bacteroides finegoldii TaxID=338188 RepID=UPI0018A11DC6|nr:hypothetical protein [Bacteroides finegoldii]